MASPFLSEIRIVSFNFAAKGWALANGQTLPINQNQALFSLLGTTYGGDGHVTFMLPNLQCRFPMHAGQGVGLSARNLGNYGGVEGITQQQTKIPQTATVAEDGLSRDAVEIVDQIAFHRPQLHHRIAGNFPVAKLGGRRRGLFCSDGCSGRMGCRTTTSLKYDCSQATSRRKVGRCAMGS